MNTQGQYRILPLEISITVISFTIGVGILSLPRALAQELGTADGWISIILGGLLFMVLYTLYVRLQRSFPGQTLLQYLGQGPIGKWGVRGLAILFILYFITIMSILVRVMSVVINMYLLDQTPAEVIVASMLLLSTYAVHKGLQGVIHLNLLFMPIILFVVFSILTINLPGFKLEPLRPVLAEGIVPVLRGIKLTFFAFLGVEILFFLMAYMKKSDLRALPFNLTVGLITVIYVLVTVFSYSIFSLNATYFITFPMLELAKEMDVPGGFIERLEALMMTVWIMTIFNTICISHYLIYSIIKNELLSKTYATSTKTKELLPSVILFFAFIVAFIPNSLTETFTFGDWSGWLGGINVFAGLLFGYLTLWLRKKRTKFWNKSI
ncbi:GerAB/ArcD/ProY family transporter [Caldalkalibacillus mannanilyticus]|uniref:GerAB/ArcD/ProY family transporter n=1 Tax=Caldalkalibacillus mannanilyticus TaxID=1418 RepID=UPI00046A3581|nr:GerAB/ArcD/ProY family transporter [Caldalkalibacillus mannanilyticus]